MAIQFNMDGYISSVFSIKNARKLEMSGLWSQRAQQGVTPKMVRRSVHFFILYSGRPARAVPRPRLIIARAALLAMYTRGQTSYDHAKYT